jgi:hypothetical protein
VASFVPASLLWFALFELLWSDLAEHPAEPAERTTTTSAVIARGQRDDAKRSTEA